MTRRRPKKSWLPHVYTSFFVLVEFLLDIYTISNGGIT